MKFSRSIRRVVSWLALVSEADIGFDAKANSVGVRVPGLLKEDGSANSKGNVIAEVPVDSIDDVMAALRQPRPQTAAEVVRSTLAFSDTEVSFKVSAESGSRTIRVPAADWSAFLDSFEGKLEDAVALMQTAAELEAEANAGTTDDSTPE